LVQDTIQPGGEQLASPYVWPAPGYQAVILSSRIFFPVSVTRAYDSEFVAGFPFVRSRRKSEILEVRGVFLDIGMDFR
jgi:hypothetical protein